MRWVGNESGRAGDPCWSTIDSVSIKEEAAHIKELNEGQVDGDAYIPAETDVSIRPSWFYHPEENKNVKTPQQLWDIYCNTVGHNSVLLLNLAPDRRGLIHHTDSANVAQLRHIIDETFQRNLLTGANIKAKNGRGGIYNAANLVDNNPDSYYAAKDQSHTDEITFKMKSASTFDCLMIQEVIELGHRITEWTVEYSDNGNDWKSIPEATNKQSIGHKRIIRFPAIAAKYVRLRITKGNACPALHTFGVFKQSSLLTK